MYTHLMKKVAMATMMVFGMILSACTKTASTTALPSPTSLPSSPTPTQSSSRKVGNTTANWKTYTDPANKFSFQYPSNFSYKNIGNNVVEFSDQHNQTKFNFGGVNIYSPSQYTHFLQRNQDLSNPQAFTDSTHRMWTTYIQLGQVYNFSGVFTQGDKDYVVFFQSGPEWLTNPSNDGSGFRQFVDQMLSTFQFQNTPLTSQQAIQLLQSEATQAYVKDYWATTDCISFQSIDHKGYYSIFIYEKHGGRCPGDPQTMPLTAVFKVYKSGVIFWEDRVTGNDIPFNEYAQEFATVSANQAQ